jgi:hypothetical protein
MKRLSDAELSALEALAGGVALISALKELRERRREPSMAERDLYRQVEALSAALDERNGIIGRQREMLVRLAREAKLIGSTEERQSNG